VSLLTFPVHSIPLIYKNSLKKKYQAFNVKIGSEAAILKYENIQPGSNAHRIISTRLRSCNQRDVFITQSESLSKSFPFWRELHKHWRTLPHYNEFWDGGSRAKLVEHHIPEDPSLKGTSGRSRAPSKKLLLSNEAENRDPTGSKSRETTRADVSKSRPKCFRCLTGFHRTVK